MQTNTRLDHDPAIAPGIYTATLIDAFPVRDHPDWGPRFCFVFQLPDGRTAERYCNHRTQSRQSIWNQIARAIQTTPGQKIEDMIGNLCRIQVVPASFNKIHDVLPIQLAEVIQLRGTNR